MRPVRRYGVNKYASAGKFRHHIGRSKVINLKNPVMRGGIRL